MSAKVTSRFININADLSFNSFKLTNLANGVNPQDAATVAQLAAASFGVSSFNTRTGPVTLSGLDVTTALGFTPYNATNPTGYITASSVDSLTNKTGNISQWTNNSGYLTSISGISAGGDLLGTYPNPTITNASVIEKVLTGYTSGAGAISATDSILSAIQKLNGNIGALTTGVSSVFGRTGAVTAQSGDYNTSQVTEVTNLYFTNSRGIAATLTGYTSGAGTISATDTVLSAIQKLNGNTGLKQNTITIGTTAQYFRGDLSLATFPTNVSTFTNDSGYLTANQTITLSGDISGSGTTAITTTIGATKVTNAMLAGSIAYSKLVLTGAILNADLAGSIAYSKLSLTGAILNADLAGSIAYSKLSLTGAILNADLAGSIADGKLASSYIFADGSRALTANWNVGAFQVKNTMTGLGVTQTETNGFFLQNTSAALTGAQQISPAVTWEGQGFQTTTSTSQRANFRAYVLPVQAANLTLSEWHLQSATNASAYSDVMVVAANAIKATFASGGLSMTSGGISFTAAVAANTFRVGSAWTFNFNSTVGAGVNCWTWNHSGAAPTSGTNSIQLFTETFNPTSGSAVYNSFQFNPTINQTGGASGITRTIYINPTLTAAADYRAIEVALGRCVFAASVTAYASINLPHGATPTTLSNGDIWTTTAGLFCRINGVTKTVTLT